METSKHGTLRARKLHINSKLFFLYLNPQQSGVAILPRYIKKKYLQKMEDVFHRPLYLIIIVISGPVFVYFLEHVT